MAKLKDALSGWTGPMPKLVCGEEGISEVAAYGDADTVVTGIVGCAGLLPTIEAIKAGKDIALANKETLISGGEVPGATPDRRHLSDPLQNPTIPRRARHSPPAQEAQRQNDPGGLGALRHIPVPAGPPDRLLVVRQRGSRLGV